MSDQPNPNELPNSAFPLTRWSVVLRVQGEDPDEARQALEELCVRYWYPLYAYARRRNLSPEDAEDATQTFLARLVSSDSLARVDRMQGRLRSFMLGGMKNFLAESWRNGNTLKRGGGVEVVSIDTARAEERFASESGGGLPEDDCEFDRIWALGLLERAMERLRAFYAGRDQIPVFEALKGCLVGDGGYGSQQALAASLGLSEEGVRSAVHRLRQRFRRYVEEEVRDTVSNEDEVRGEIAQLCRILAHQ